MDGLGSYPEAEAAHNIHWFGSLFRAGQQFARILVHYDSVTDWSRDSNLRPFDKQLEERLTPAFKDLHVVVQEDNQTIVGGANYFVDQQISSRRHSEIRRTQSDLDFISSAEPVGRTVG